MESAPRSQAQLHLLPVPCLLDVLCHLTHASYRLVAFGALCRDARATLSRDVTWKNLCKRYWYATERRLAEWPALSPFGLYRALERWAPLEGFYTLVPAFPWGLLVLLRLSEGCVRADVIRFIPKDAFDFEEVHVALFRINLGESRPGDLRESVAASWAPRNARVSAPDPRKLCAHTAAAAESFDGLDIGHRGLYTARRVLRVEDEAEEPWPLTQPLAQPLGRRLKAACWHRISRWAPRVCRRRFAPQLGMPDGTGESSPPPVQCTSARWDPQESHVDAPAVREQTHAMLQDMMGDCRIPCDLALIRSTKDLTPQDPNLDLLRPGLYVGDYGHEMYGQFREEVLLLEYTCLSPEDLRAELESPSRVFARPGRNAAPGALRALGELGEDVTFISGIKQCGDLHVPMGATSFVAVCGPPEACSMIAEGAPRAPATVADGVTGVEEQVVNAWRGFGTLAVTGFFRPMWEGGWLVRVTDSSASGSRGHRFGFIWDQNQDTIILNWVQSQDTCPFLQRAWLPEDLR